MLPREYDTQVCSVARALEIVGERWSLLVVRSLMLGCHRFDDLQAMLGVTRSVLSARLKRLEAEGVIERRPYQDRPVRHEYHLTAKGGGLWPVITHLMLWGDEHYPEPGGTPWILEHRDCGGHPDAALTCDRCGASLGPGDIRAHPNPAVPTATGS